jgi:hypothetical protein
MLGKVAWGGGGMGGEGERLKGVLETTENPYEKQCGCWWRTGTGDFAKGSRPPREPRTSADSPHRGSETPNAWGF